VSPQKSISAFKTVLKSGWVFSRAAIILAKQRRDLLLVQIY
jgi:hypothetical protein